MKKIPFKILNEIPNSSSIKIGGLVLDKHSCYTTSSGYKTSSLNKIELPSTKLIKKLSFSDTVFLTDLTLLNDKLYVLTMNEEKCYVYSKELELLNTFSFHGKGWGITNNGEHLIMNDQNNHLIFRCPQSFEIIKTLSITTNNNSSLVFGSLTFAKGIIWTNPLNNPNNIIGIDTNTGKIIKVLDISPLVHKEDHSDEPHFFLSRAIFYDQVKEQIVITSSQWKYIYMLSTQE